MIWFPYAFVSFTFFNNFNYNLIWSSFFYQIKTNFKRYKKKSSKIQKCVVIDNLIFLGHIIDHNKHNLPDNDVNRFLFIFQQTTLITFSWKHSRNSDEMNIKDIQ